MSKNLFEEIKKTIEQKDFNERTKEFLFSKNEFVYVSNKNGGDLIDRIYKDGTRRIGKITNGVWVEVSCG